MPNGQLVAVYRQMQTSRITPQQRLGMPPESECDVDDNLTGALTIIQLYLSILIDNFIRC